MKAQHMNKFLISTNLDNLNVTCACVQVCVCASVRNCVVDESVSLHKGCLCLMIASRQLTASCEAVGHNRQLFRCSCISTSASRQQQRHTHTFCCHSPCSSSSSVHMPHLRQHVRQKSRFYF